MRRRLVTSGACEEGCLSPPTELFGSRVLSALASRFCRISLMMNLPDT